MKKSKSQKRAQKQKQAKKALATKQHEINRKKKVVKLPNFITCNECGGRAPNSTFEVALLLNSERRHACPIVLDS